MEQKFNLNLEKAAKEINKRNSKKILIQMPEGMKLYSLEILTYLSKNTKAEIIFSGETNWGGCDLALDEAKNLQADLILHFGHARFISVNFPVVYIEVEDNTDLFPLLKESLKDLKNKTICLATSVQHIHKLEEIKKFYEGNNIKVVIPNKKGFSAYNGHITGCEYSSLKLIQNNVDLFLVLGNQFHGLGASLSVTKPVILLDTYNLEIKNLDSLKNKITQQRAIAINKIKTARNIGIILSLKPGQKFGNFRLIKEKLEALNKNVFIITMNGINQDKLNNFYNIDGFIELACPRIAIDDYSKYEKPIITFKEALVVLNELKWEDLLSQGFL